MTIQDNVIDEDPTGHVFDASLAVIEDNVFVDAALVA